MGYCKLYIVNCQIVCGTQLFMTIWFMPLPFWDSANVAHRSSTTSRSKQGIRSRRTTANPVNVTATQLPATTTPAWTLTLRSTSVVEGECVITALITPQVTIKHDIHLLATSTHLSQYNLFLWVLFRDSVRLVDGFCDDHSSTCFTFL